MSYQDDQERVRRAGQLAEMCAELISCHVGWSEQAAGKTADALLDQVHRVLRGTGAKIIAMGGLRPGSVAELRRYVDEDSLFAIVAGSSITRSGDPAGVVDAFQDEVRKISVRADVDITTRTQTCALQ
jgi:3-keto-L-gulonate-6-phosphate decarboxylase